MTVPLQITFHNFPYSEAVAADVRRRAEKIGALARGIRDLRVVVDRPNHRHQKGDHYHVRLSIRMRGAEIVVDRDPVGDSSREDLYLAIRNAFEAAQRRIKSFAGLKRDARGITGGRTPDFLCRLDKP